MSKRVLIKACGVFVMLTLVCGILYTGVVTVLAQALFPNQANGSIIKINGINYGCSWLGQNYTQPGHMWGRITNLDTSTFKDDKGNILVYAGPSNLSPNSKKYATLVEERVHAIQVANPDMKNTPIPEDLVTCSGSGLDPEISPAAAEYQVLRIAKATGKTPNDIRTIISKCTTGRFLGLIGEPRVNVLKVNLMLDGVM